MRMFNRRENPNAIFGVFLLILLAVFAGPTVLPELIARSLPFADEGVPCDWLRDGSQRSTNQSLVGRAVNERAQRPPISLAVRSSRVATDNTITVTVIVTNQTLGTVPILITEDDLIVNPQEPRNGLGVIFGQAAIPTGIGESVNAAYDPGRIRLLGPRQICVQRVTLSVSEIANGSALVAENVTVTAFYRNNSPGNLPLTAQSLFPDQGLWIGQVESEQTLVGTG